MNEVILGVSPLQRYKQWGGVWGGIDTCASELASGARHVIAVSDQIDAFWQLVMIKQLGGEDGIFASVHAGVVAGGDGLS